MSSLESKGTASPPSQRHSVRIVRRRTPTQAATLSLAITAVAAAALYLTWLAWRVVETPRAVSDQVVRDLTLLYRCEAGHSFEAAARVDPYGCPTCGKPSYAAAKFSCPTHGETWTKVKFKSSAASGFRAAAYSAAGEGWIPADLPLPCPQCGQTMTRSLDRDLDELGLDSKRRFPGDPGSRRPPPTEGG